MSYTRTYHGSVTVNGSVSASYPASEHGGTHTVSYSETVPVDINITVDTNDFEESVERTNLTVDGLTGAVAVMDAAQCKAIRDNSIEISDKIIEKFFETINSEMSMQKVESGNKVKTKIALLASFAKDIVQKHERMNSDVTRTRIRFMKLFNDMDDDLERRIKKLDQPIFRLSEQVRSELINQPIKQYASASLSHINEGNRAQSLIISARMKKKIHDSIKNIADSIVKNVQYENSVADSLSSIDCKTPQTEFIPAIVCQGKDLTESGRASTGVFVADIGQNERIISEVGSNVLNKDDGQWKAIPEDELKIIDQEFMKIMERGYSEIESTNPDSERVFQEIAKMWKANQRLLMKL